MIWGESLYDLPHTSCLTSVPQQGIFPFPAVNLISLQIMAIFLLLQMFINPCFEENAWILKSLKQWNNYQGCKWSHSSVWPSFTCSGGIGNQWNSGRGSCVRGHGMIYKWNMQLLTDRRTLQQQWQDFIYFYGGIQLCRVETNLVKHREVSSTE